MSYVEYSPALCGSGDTLTAHTTKRRTVSLIMPVKNEERSIGPTLDAVLASTRLPDEIIIADGQSVDRTLERVQAYIGRGVTIRVVPNPQIFAGAGRNRAAAVATSDILLFLDSGILVHPRWIEEMTRPFEQDVGVDAVGGMLDTYVESDFEYCVASIQRGEMMLFSRLSRAEQLARVPAEFRLSGVMAISRTCYQRLGGMPAWLRASEDKLFGCKLRIARARIVLSLDALCYLHMRTDTKSLFMQNFIYARGDGHLHTPLDYRSRRNMLFYIAILVAVGYGAVHPATLPVPLLMFAAYLYRTGVRNVMKVGGGIVRLSHLLRIPQIIIAKDAGTYLGHFIGLFDWITKPHYRQLYQDYMKR
jgi:glycosyltransferase involved in cell wall biosynthesis